MEDNPEKMKIAVFCSWELFNSEKNDILRLACIHGYYKIDPDKAIQRALET